jgi:hypothetical protein
MWIVRTFENTWLLCNFTIFHYRTASLSRYDCKNRNGKNTHEQPVTSFLRLCCWVWFILFLFRVRAAPFRWFGLVAEYIYVRNYYTLGSHQLGKLLSFAICAHCTTAKYLDSTVYSSHYITVFVCLFHFYFQFLL